MGSLHKLLFLALASFCTVSGHPSEDPVPEPEPTEGVTAIGEAFSATAPTLTKAKPTTTSNGLVTDRTRLRADLLSGYDKNIIPDNVTVKFGIALIDFDIDEDRSTVEMELWQRLVWKDSRLAWNEEDYGGITVLRLNPDDFWKPDITLYTSANPAKMMDCWKSNILLYSSGEVLWVPPCHATSKCENLNLSEFPYGEQNCTLKFGSWTYDGFTMDIQLYNKEERMDISDMWKNPKWEILSNTAARSDKYYDCCAEPYPDIKYTFTFKRLSEIPCSTRKE